MKVLQLILVKNLLRFVEFWPDWPSHLTIPDRPNWPDGPNWPKAQCVPKERQGDIRNVADFDFIVIISPITFKNTV